MDPFSSPSSSSSLSLPLIAHVGRQDQESCAKYLGEMRTIMFGDGEQEPDPSLQTALVTETHKVGLIPHLIALLPTLFFETRKDAAATFNALVRFPLDDPAGGKRLPFVEFLTSNPSNLVILLKGSELVGRQKRSYRGVSFHPSQSPQTCWSEKNKNQKL